MEKNAAVSGVGEWMFLHAGTNGPIFLAARLSDSGIFQIEGIYPEIHEVTEEILLTLGRPEPNIDVWHRRLGHLCEKTIKDLARRDESGIPKSVLSQTLGACDVCLQGKAKTLPFA